MCSMGTIWKNKTRDICIQRHGPDEYNKRIRKVSQTSEGGGIFSTKPFMSMSQKAKKVVANSSQNILRRCHAVGAVGYAVVRADERIPPNDFFIEGRRFRLRFRHSNVYCDDDAGCCQREASVKFSDQNEDGPLDLILFTGRTAPARNCKGLADVLKLTSPNEVRTHCEKDPNYYFSLVDGLRRAPTSFAHLTYHSQMPYQFTPSDGQPRSARFRLIPGTEGVSETGQVDDRDQEHPWETGRRADEQRDTMYLRNEFIERLRQDEPVTYILQMQLASAADQSMWDPQMILDEDIYPWLNVMKIELTTFLPTIALRRTFFNIVEKPKCLQFPSPTSSSSPLSYQKLWSAIYTEFELKHKRQVVEDADDVLVRDLVKYEVTIQTKALKEGRVPPVDISITLAGTDSRSTPRPLTHNLNLSPKDGIERYEIEAVDVGELLAVTVAVKYRQLADDWYLRDVTVSDARDRNRIHRFPCHAVVLSNTTLRSGEACLAHKQSFEIHRQERLLDLSEKQNDYTWQVNGNGGHCWPAQIRGRTVQQLPPYEAQRAAKYNGMLWQVDQELVDFFRSLRYKLTTTADVRDVSGGSRASSFQSAGAVMNRQMSLQTGFNASEARRRTAMMRQLSVDVTPVYAQDSAAEEENKALARWKKIKRQVKVISESKIPEGSKGEMCREIQNDVEFARNFTGGINPTLIRRCTSIPTNFPVTQEMVAATLDRRKSLDEEIKDGRVYLANYSLLDDIPVIHRDADHRYMVAPLVLLYVRASGDLVPLAIQLKQSPGPDNPIWTPNDRPEQWMLAKLWTRCADFHWGFGLAHYFRCHALMEPFAIATMRRLSTAHPVYKLLKPHLRYTIATNTLMRANVLKKGGLLDRYTSLGFDGFQALISRYAKTRFSFAELDPIQDFKARDVYDDRRLPNYFYRDDSVRIWNCLYKCCMDILGLFYESPEDVARDGEISDWLRELHDVGFPGMTESQRRGLPGRFESVADVADLVTKVIFTLTAQHSATHSDAVDFHGFMPDIPAMMRLPPPNSRDYVVDRDVLTKTLPDQFPDAYYGTLAFVMQIYRPDENTLGVCDEVHFVEPEVLAIYDDFRKSLNQITTTERARNIIAGYIYENLMPAYIPTSPEPLPFVPRDRLRKALKGLGPHLCRDIFFRETHASVPLMTLPLCRQFARTLGGRSSISRRLTMTIVKGLRETQKGSPGVAVSVAALDEEDEDEDVMGACNYPTAKRQPMRESRLRSSNF